MPSYTFSSSTTLGRHPRHLNGLSFLATVVVLTVLAITGMEMFWRSKGHFPVVGDTASRWGLYVDKIPDNDPSAILVVGSSRVQLGIDTDLMQREMGASTAIQLSRAASSPMPMLDYLMNATEFSGTLICGINPGLMFDAQERGQDNVRAMLEQRENRPYYTPLEEILLGWSQGGFTVNNASVSWKLAGNAIFRGKWPTPPYGRLTGSRFMRVDYELCTDLEKLRADYMNVVQDGHAMGDEQFKALLNDLQQVRHTVERRGGRILFVRMPSSDVLWDLEDARCPKDRFWNVLKERFGSDAVHFHEIEQALGEPFVCPDSNHLDYRDAARLTEYLCDHLRKTR